MMRLLLLQVSHAERLIRFFIRIDFTYCLSILPLLYIYIYRDPDKIMYSKTLPVQLYMLIGRH